MSYSLIFDENVLIDSSFTVTMQFVFKFFVLPENSVSLNRSEKLIIVKRS